MLDGSSKRVIVFSITCFCWLLGSARPASNAQVAHQHPNLTGIWVLDRSQSIPQRPGRKYSKTLEIKHNDPEITVASQVETDGWKTRRTFTLFTDGRGEVNKDEAGKYKSVSHWSGSQLERRYSRVLRINRQGPGIGELMFVDLKAVELWELSDDGKTLIVKESGKQAVQEVNRQPPDDVFEFQWVYKRSP